VSSKTRCYFCNNPSERLIKIRGSEISLCTYCSEDVAKQLTDVHYYIYFGDLVNIRDRIVDVQYDLEFLIEEMKRRKRAVEKESTK